MKESYRVAGIVALVVFAIGLLGFSIRNSLDNGERPNPNAGHPSKKPSSKNLSKVDNITEQDFKENLKANRPDLSEAELQKKADEWWKVKSGQ